MTRATIYNMLMGNNGNVERGNMWRLLQVRRPLRRFFNTNKLCKCNYDNFEVWSGEPEKNFLNGPRLNYFYPFWATHILFKQLIVWVSQTWNKKSRKVLSKLPGDYERHIFTAASVVTKWSADLEDGRAHAVEDVVHGVDPSRTFANGT